MQIALFARPQTTLDLGEGAWIRHQPRWLDRLETEAFSGLFVELPWERRTWRDQTKMPRDECFLGDEGLAYTYSGLCYQAKPWHPDTAQIAARLRAELDVPFNAVFGNRYNSGDDSIGWHADDEPVLGPRDQIVIASVSLGGSRRFRLRHQHDRTRTHQVELGDGDLLVMGGTLQRDWHHCVPKTQRPCGRRINLTFRVLDPVRG